MKLSIKYPYKFLPIGCNKTIKMNSDSLHIEPGM